MYFFVLATRAHCAHTQKTTKVVTGAWDLLKTTEHDFYFPPGPPFGRTTWNIFGKSGNIVYSVDSYFFLSTLGVFCSTAIETATADKDVATIKQVRAKAQQAVKRIGALGQGHLMSFDSFASRSKESVL